MPTQPYRLRDGTRVPGVTTILGICGDKQGIIYSANRLALEPALRARHLIDIAVNGGTDDARLNWDANARAFLEIDSDNWDHKKFWGKAADAGTCAHEMFECHIRKQIFVEAKYELEIVALAKPAFAAAAEWAGQSKLEIVETEVPLVSEKYRFGGTRDGVLVSGKRAIADWKTSNDVYPEYLAQLAAYGILDEEAGNVIDGGFHLVKFSKQKKPTDPVRFQHHYWSHLDQGRKLFLLVREAYDLIAELKEIAK